MKKSEEKLNLVYEYVKNFIIENGYSPSVRDVCKDLNIKSTATAHLYLNKLNSLGKINKAVSHKRAISLNENSSTFSVPLIGTVTAGTPIFATENYEDYYSIPKEFYSENETFMLKIQGDSMINAGIYNGDKIIVQKTNVVNNGEIAVVLIDDNATVKRFYKKNNKIILHPENENYEDIVLDSAIILGKVIGLIRKF